MAQVVYKKEDMQPVVDYMAKNISLIPEEAYQENLKKIVDNFKVALDAAADNDEKQAYLYALYVNNAAAMVSHLLSYGLLTPEMLKEYYTLPSRSAAEEALAPYREANEKENNEIADRQKAFMDHNRGLEVFKAIALGSAPEEAKQNVENYENQMKAAMQR